VPPKNVSRIFRRETFGHSDPRTLIHLVARLYRRHPEHRRREGRECRCLLNRLVPLDAVAEHPTNLLAGSVIDGPAEANGIAVRKLGNTDFSVQPDTGDAQRSL
jgi:hypothetical protein